MTRPLLELLERASLAQLAERFRADDETSLTELFPSETLALLRAISQEAPLELPDANDDRPVVVLVPGLLGSQLASRDGTPLWTGAPRALRGDTARRLAIPEPAWTQRFEESDVVPGRPLYLAYGPALTAWRLCGMHVETIAHDWRREVRDEARRFGEQVRALRAKHPASRPMILVAHSTGGLVACAWAQREDAELDVFTRVALVAVPLGGSYDAVAAHLGEPWLAHALGLASLDETMDEVRAMARSFPALAQLHPHPAMLGASQRRPIHDALDSNLLHSPLLRRAVRFYSTWYPTQRGVERDGSGRPRIAGHGPGDFVVPLASLRAGGSAPTLQTTVWHPQTVLDPVVIAKVLAWGYEGAAALMGDAADVQACDPPDDVAPDDPRFSSMRPPDIDVLATAADEAILTR